MLPAVVLAGFAATMAWAARDRFLPARPVRVVPVLVARAEVRPAGTALFRSAGWIEPSPAPVIVSALAEGMVNELLVVEGESVDAGQPLARLIDVDARRAVAQAEADVDLRRAELAAAEAELAAAEARLREPVHLAVELAEADRLLAEAEAELETAPFRQQIAEASLRYAEQQWEAKRAAGEAIAGRALRQARSDLDTARAGVEEVRLRRPRLEQEIEALRRKRSAVARQLELKVEESREVAEAKASVQAAQARLRQAELALEAARLQLERMVVTSPMAGRVLQVVAQPGSRLMGLVPHAAQDSSTVVTLYDPARLQVRADVRLEDLPLVEPGQPVRIETASLAKPIDGRVLDVTSRASVQKNTLEVKVAIDAPPEGVRPEMLVQATFLAPEGKTAPSADEHEGERILVPRELVERRGDEGLVWVAAPDGKARRSAVRLGLAGTAELVEVASGLTATDKLIVSGRDGLVEGQRVAISGEDITIGTQAGRQP
ncbi:MAG: HlyD family efflux transporter periplasmic adaptor subunit [Thermoguttaceae bacterium]|nr:HlyD family efflux transporter periplasmic adaptor subunit [Thermoguttaceae bacterium]